jgi:hypothetical protein
VSKVYVVKGTNKPFVTSKETERLIVAVVESHRVKGLPRTRVVRHLGGFDPRKPVEPGDAVSRTIMERIRGLDISDAEKRRFLKDIQARGVAFWWPKTLDPITKKERGEIQARVDAEFEKFTADLVRHGLKKVGKS